ncbi:MAG: DivIVA domain-containing protein [Oscillospiraceae bacterium]|nr:DivIVA domain-containing protein [Oscillospiraceae bacterium]
MLTPQEVSERAFAKASFGGYNMAMVDEFLDILTVDYTALYNDNAVLKSKMKVLVDKVEEYRATEEAMRKALMTAQRMADQLVKEAEEKKATILQDAEREAADKIACIRQEVTNEEYRLTAAQNATAAYVARIKQLHQQELDYLDNLAQLTPAPKAEEVNKVDETAQAIENSVLRLLSVEEEPAVQEPEEELEHTTEFEVAGQTQQEDLTEEEIEQTEDEMDKTAVHHIDFGRLEFGRDYEIK